jgi:membrane protease YdiL (CAAX protease family)
MRALAVLRTLDALRVIVPAALALLVAVILDRQSARKGLSPPGFAVPWRRSLATACIAAVLWIGVTLPLGTIGTAVPAPDFAAIPTPQLFLLHALMTAAVLAWFFLGFAAVPAPQPGEPRPLAALEAVPPSDPEPSERVTDEIEGVVGEPVVDSPRIAMEEGAAEAVFPYAAPGAVSVLAPLPAAAEPPAPPLPPASLGRRFAEQLGLVAPSVPRELGLGVLLGIAAWVVVLSGMMAIGGILYAVGGDKALPKAPPAMVSWIAALPILIRMSISLSAGVVEEGFFRGFLQPRVGIVLSTCLFVLAHFSYGQPFMLIGITLLSLIYAYLVRWRQTIWPAIAAHALFDGVQLLVVIPGALKLMQTQAPKAAALLGFW